MCREAIAPVQRSPRYRSHDRAAGGRDLNLITSAYRLSIGSERRLPSFLRLFRLVRPFPVLINHFPFFAAILITFINTYLYHILLFVGASFYYISAHEA
ncbi:hypothetical protein Y032_0017g3183 [Ancylostoma ceylanicum]|uniref:Uncharacterized protein n=1 Tax=Ancylostoma ceylanicum TaxID=53326 RepID=A0A016V3Z0_9BILA|nr:hypothetical protein Y032_0017g3183 [Ancylostoma ceylanicum]